MKSMFYILPDIGMDGHDDGQMFQNFKEYYDIVEVIFEKRISKKRLDAECFLLFFNWTWNADIIRWTF